MSMRLPGRWLLPALCAVALALISTVFAPGLTTTWHWSDCGGGLSDASVRLLNRVSGELTLTIALPNGHPLRGHARRLVEAYRRQVPVALEFVAPKGQPERARKLGLVRTGSGLVGWQGHHERFTAPSEVRISTALQRLIRRSQQYAVWLTGHGERRPDRQTNYDMHAFASALERRGYRIQTLLAGSVTRVPDNTAVLMVAAPRSAFDEATRQLLDDYLTRGGDLLWFAEPGGRVSALLPVRLGKQSLNDPRAQELLGVDNTRLLLMHPRADHVTARGLRAPVLLSGAAGLVATSSDWKSAPLIKGPARLAGEPSHNPALALVRESDDATQRVAVLGDADFLADTYLGNGANLPYGLNLVDWVTGAGELTGTFVRNAPDQNLVFSRLNVLLLGFGHLFALPALLTLAGVLAWRRQRR